MVTLPVPSPFGTLTLCGEDGALVRLCFPWETPPTDDGAGERETLLRGAAWLERYFRGEDPGCPPLCAPRGTAYRERVWLLLREIPYGGCTTYGALAERYLERFKEHTSPRAVGGAVGHNPLPILLPCHRVLGSGGTLTGYAGGLKMKKALLELEKIM